MIKVNGEEIKIEHFPDGTPRINLNINNIVEYEYDGCAYVDIDWFYENDSELFYLMLIKKHIERHFTDVHYVLYMPYVPNARMDRTKCDDEVFTLKYFCDFINSLNFDNVFVLDVHSNVSTALLNNCANENPKEYVERAINKINSDDNLVLFFPDEGSMKRYSDLFELPYCFGMKKRDWKTGKILGLDIIDNGIDLKDKTILIIDDISSRGGTFYYSSLALKEKGVRNIYLYISHCENTILEGEVLTSGLIEKVFTTNSIFTKEHEKIEVFGLD